MFNSDAHFISFLVFSILFGLTSLINIVCGFFEFEKIRRLSKPFCLIFLGIAAFIAAPAYFLIYIGCFFGAIGDFFLLYKNKRLCLISGLSSFLIGHFCYIANTIMMVAELGVLEWWAYLVMFVIYFAFMLITAGPIWGLTKHSKLFTISGTIYCSTLLSVIGTSALGLYFIGVHWYLFVLLGSILFFSSDVILTSTMFRHDFPRRDFYIMLTYLLGQAGIVYGIIFTIL